MRNCYAANALLLQNSYATTAKAHNDCCIIASQALRKRFTITVQSKRIRCAIASQSLQNRYFRRGTILDNQSDCVKITKRLEIAFYGARKKRITIVANRLYDRRAVVARMSSFTLTQPHFISLTHPHLISLTHPHFISLTHSPTLTHPHFISRSRQRGQQRATRALQSPLDTLRAKCPTNGQKKAR
jgi:hypothetical protein